MLLWSIDFLEERALQEWELIRMKVRCRVMADMALNLIRKLKTYENDAHLTELEEQIRLFLIEEDALRLVVKETDV